MPARARAFASSSPRASTTCISSTTPPGGCCSGEGPQADNSSVCPQSAKTKRLRQALRTRPGPALHDGLGNDFLDGRDGSDHIDGGDGQNVGGSTLV